jgi:hypothetical protein
MGVSSSMVRLGVAAMGELTELASPLFGDMTAGDCDLLPNAASRVAVGSRGTSDFGGCSLRRGGSREPARSSVGRCRDLLSSSLS